MGRIVVMGADGSNLLVEVPDDPPSFSLFDDLDLSREARLCSSGQKPPPPDQGQHLEVTMNDGTQDAAAQPAATTQPAPAPAAAAQPDPAQASKDQPAPVKQAQTDLDKAAQVGAAVTGAVQTAQGQQVVQEQARPVGFFDRVARELSAEEQKVMYAAREAANKLLDSIKNLGVSRELNIATTKLEEVMHRVEAHFKLP